MQVNGRKVGLHLSPDGYMSGFRYRVLETGLTYPPYRHYRVVDTQEPKVLLDTSRKTEAFSKCRELNGIKKA